MKNSSNILVDIGLFLIPQKSELVNLRQDGTAFIREAIFVNNNVENVHVDKKADVIHLGPILTSTATCPHFKHNSQCSKR